MRRPFVTHEKAAFLSTAVLMLSFGVLAWKPWDRGDVWVAAAIYAASVLALGGMLDYLFKDKR